MVEWLETWAIFICPAVIGLSCLAGGIALIAGRNKPQNKGKTGRVVLAIILLIVALGIGGCYSWLAAFAMSYGH